MGTLEALRDAATDPARTRHGYDGVHEIGDWVEAGCPGYEPEPWGKGAAMLIRDGVYAYQYGDSLVGATAVRGGVPNFVEVLEILQASPIDLASYLKNINFRYLCPLPTPPEGA